jgi:hypothetical protein
MTDPGQWTVAVLVSVALGVVLAIFSAPAWAYPVALGIFIAAILFYQRVVRPSGDD